MAWSRGGCLRDFRYPFASLVSLGSLGSLGHWESLGLLLWEVQRGEAPGCAGVGLWLHWLGWVGSSVGDPQGRRRSRGRFMVDHSEQFLRADTEQIAIPHAGNSGSGGEAGDSAGVERTGSDSSESPGDRTVSLHVRGGEEETPDRENRKKGKDDLSDSLARRGGEENETSETSLDSVQVSEADKGSGSPARLGSYELVRMLARGGMGEIWLGRDPGLNRPVAIKRLALALLEEPECLERFKREARAAAAVSHPNIAAIHHVGTDDEGRPYLAMEYINGINLAALSRRREPVPYSTVADWMIQACLGLQAAFKANVIHRDLKPGNLMVTRSGGVKIVDFGLAKIFFEDQGHKTQTGLVLGTPHYMSPEQGQGRGLDHRSDIYSLGATFYCLLAGRPPFDGPSLVDVMMKHITAPLVPLYSVNPEVPLALCDIIHRMMAKNPNDRPQDYEDLIADLKSVKLQLLAKEQGSFVGRESDGPAADPVWFRDEKSESAAASGSVEESDADLKAIVGGGRSQEGGTGAARGAGNLQSVEVTRPGPASRESEQMGPLRLILLGVGLLILLGGLLMVAFRTGAEDADPVEAGEVDSRSSGLAAALTRILAEEPQPTPIPVPPDLAAARETRANLMDLSIAILAYESDHRRAPDTLEAVVSSGVIDPQKTRDGWDRPLQLRRITGELLSFGADGEENTADDLLVEIGTALETLPEPYRALEEEYEAKVKAAATQP